MVVIVVITYTVSSEDGDPGGGDGSRRPKNNQTKKHPAPQNELSRAVVVGMALFGGMALEQVCHCGCGL